ncbi:hypothetical protein AMB3_1899 [plant metagenome]
MLQLTLHADTGEAQIMNGRHGEPAFSQRIFNQCDIVSGPSHESKSNFA